MIWNIPNLLTLLRLLAAPGLALLFLFVPRPLADWLALGLFIVASLTDWFDGHLARAWNQQTRLGAMLDPIADKAMVAIALLVLATRSSLTSWVLLPATLILFREVFVSGLREYLGQAAGTLKVTKLAKGKTTVQMVAIAVLLGHGGLEHALGMAVFGMGPELLADIMAGGDDPEGFRARFEWMRAVAQLGLVLIWVAAFLTLITGWDYFRKALPLLKEA